MACFNWPTNLVTLVTASGNRCHQPAGAMHAGMPPAKGNRPCNANDQHTTPSHVVRVCARNHSLLTSLFGAFSGEVTFFLLREIEEKLALSATSTSQAKSHRTSPVPPSLPSFLSHRSLHCIPGVPPQIARSSPTCANSKH